MKIVYVFTTLASKGGTERIVVEKANYMAEHFGYDVSIICCNQQPDRPNFYQLSDKVRQYYLSIPYYTQYLYKYPKRLWVKISLNIRLRKKLAKTVSEINPDIVIGLGHFMANVVSTLPCKAKKVIECHEARYCMSSYMGNRSFLTKIYHHYYAKRYFRTTERNADLVVVLTTGAKYLWRKARRVEIIPNFSTLAVKQYSNCQTKRVIAAGRLGKEKGFERLIDIWKIVSEKHPDWQLDILGDGELYDSLTEKIKNDHVRNVTLCGASNDMSQEYANSSICVVTSYFEGFSLVLIEAMKHGVPCIAFDCPYGPRNIIEDNQCGYLIKDGDIKAFAEKLSKLIADEEQRKQFSAAAIERAKHYDTDVIMTQWKNLLEGLILS